MSCDICPRACKVDRNVSPGFCNELKTIKIAKIIRHFSWEEPCLSDKRGTLAIFFSGCNLACDYCQNFEISRGGVGKTYSLDEFKNLIEKEQNFHSSIDLITPTHFAPALCEAFEKIEKKVPIIYNTNSYENVETIEKVAKFVDVFLADFKYADDALGKQFSHCNDYFSTAISSITKMCELKPDIEKSGQLVQGVIIRHLVLPGQTKNSFEVLDAVSARFANRKLSLMSQFTPNGHSKLDRKLLPIEYKAVVAHLEKLGITNGYIQDFESADTTYIPKF